MLREHVIRNMVVRLHLLLIVILCSGYGAGAAEALPTSDDWQSKQIEIKFQKKSFSDYLEFIEKQTGRSIVADDLPLKQQADLEWQGTVREALDRVADLFDYSWTESKRGVILMTKRFKDPQEHPQMNLPEMHEMTRVMLGLVTPYGVSDDQLAWVYGTASFWKLLTDDQKTRLQHGESLKYGDFAKDQQEAIQHVVMNHLLTDFVNNWTRLMEFCDGVPKSHIVVNKPKPANLYLVFPGHDRELGSLIIYIDSIGNTIQIR